MGNYSVGNEPETPAEVRVWQAVLLQAVEEWKSGPLRLQRQAEEYLFGNNSDFPEVCRRAGTDAARLRAQLLRLRGTPVQTAQRLAA